MSVTLGNQIIDFSIIVPVYNRPQEMDEFLASLAAQSDCDFEVVVMEGTCKNSCRTVCDRYADRLNIQFHSRDTGRSDRRNEGMRLAKGNYFMLFDSDCILPKDYVATVRGALQCDYVDCYGGPDSADNTFSDMQLAVNYSMTSIMTTGGIRGGMKNVNKYLPRAFNMGFSRTVFDRTGGYLEMIGEDVDLSMRIKEAGFSVRLIKSAYVYHKRRVSLKGFYKQTNTFGKARVLLSWRHPGSLKLMHLFPSCFAIGNIGLLLFAILFRSWWWLLPIAVYVTAILVESLLKNRRLKVAFLSVVTSYAQLCGYGFGYIDEFVTRRASRKSSETLYRQS